MNFLYVSYIIIKKNKWTTFRNSEFYTTGSLQEKTKRHTLNNGIHAWLCNFKVHWHHLDAWLNIVSNSATPRDSFNRNRMRLECHHSYWQISQEILKKIDGSPTPNSEAPKGIVGNNFHSQFLIFLILTFKRKIIMRNED